MLGRVLVAASRRSLLFSSRIVGQRSRGLLLRVIFLQQSPLPISAHLQSNRAFCINTLHYVSLRLNACRRSAVALNVDEQRNPSDPPACAENPANRSVSQEITDQHTGVRIVIAGRLCRLYTSYSYWQRGRCCHGTLGVSLRRRRQEPDTWNRRRHHRPEGVRTHGSPVSKLVSGPRSAEGADCSPRRQLLQSQSSSIFPPLGGSELHPLLDFNRHRGNVVQSMMTD